MNKFRKDYECILRDTNTGVDLLRMHAQQVGDPTFSAGYEGGGVASGSQNFSVLVFWAYDLEKGQIVDNIEDFFNPLEQNVIINGKKWLLTNYTPVVRRKLGANWSHSPNMAYLLNLE